MATALPVLPKISKTPKAPKSSTAPPRRANDKRKMGTPRTPRKVVDASAASYKMPKVVVKGQRPPGRPKKTV